MQIKEYKIRQLNKKYFQKSTFFLYPLLKIPKTVIPMDTYVTWDDFFDLDRNVLVCRYKKFVKDTERKTEVEHLIKHPLYLDYYELEDDTIVYVFAIETFQGILELFLKGKYSKFPDSIKDRIVSFYKPETHTRAYMKSYLFPDAFYEIYSELLNVPISLLKEIVELASPPDMEKEKLQLKVKNIDIKLTK